MRDGEGTFIVSGATPVVLEDGTGYVTGYWAGSSRRYMAMTDAGHGVVGAE